MRFRFTNLIWAAFLPLCWFSCGRGPTEHPVSLVLRAEIPLDRTPIDLQLSDEGKHLLVRGDGLEVIRAEDGARFSALPGLPKREMDAYLSPSGLKLMVSSSDGVLFYNLDQPGVVSEKKIADHFGSPVMDPSETLVYAQSGDAILALEKRTHGVIGKFNLKLENCRGAALHPQGFLAVCGKGGVQIIDPGNAVTLGFLGDPGQVFSEPRFCASGKLLLVEHGQKLMVWDWAEGKLLKSLDKPRFYAVHPVEPWLSFPEMGKVRSIHLQDENQTFILPLPKVAEPGALAWSPDGSRLAVFAHDRLMLFGPRPEPVVKEERTQLPPRPQTSLGRALSGAPRFGPFWVTAHKEFAWLDEDDYLRFQGTQKPARMPQLPGLPNQIAAAEVDPYGRFLAVAAGSSFEIWDLQLLSKSQSTHLDHGVRAMAFQPQSTFLWFVDQPGRVRIWNWALGEEMPALGLQVAHCRKMRFLKDKILFLQEDGYSLFERAGTWLFDSKTAAKPLNNDFHQELSKLIKGKSDNPFDISTEGVVYSFRRGQLQATIPGQGGMIIREYVQTEKLAVQGEKLLIYADGKAIYQSFQQKK